MTVEPLSPRMPGQQPGPTSSLAAMRDLAGGIVFYGLFGIGVLGPICLALVAELTR